MALTPRLDLRQSQTLVMTPQLQQAIKLLQLSNLELSTFVEQELERNPLLEMDDERDGPIEEGPAPATEVPEAPMVDALPGQAEETPLDIDYDNTWNNDADAESGFQDGAFQDWRGQGGRPDFDQSDSNLEQTLTREESLRDHLMGQINMDLADPIERLIALALLELLDESGYLVGSIEDTAERLGCEVAQVEAVLERVQHFDPPGIFARSLAECLRLQLRERNRLDPAMAMLLERLDLLAKRDLPGLLKACGVDSEDLAEMIAEIRSLDPKPALVFDHTAAQPVVPDVMIRAQAGGGWLVELNTDTLPRVLVNSRFYAKVAAGTKDKEERSYLSERYQSANWLVKSLHQRATTILKVATEIVRQQDAFLQRGIRHLRPLVLRDIADAIGMHESTVSRVTANKFMATPRGIYELKYFFTQAIAGAAGGEAHSAEAVRDRIKTLIDDETAAEVLSDDRLVEILRSAGIDISRRTVCKYREAMHIASSVHRRREKLISG